MNICIDIDIDIDINNKDTNRLIILIIARNQFIEHESREN